MGGRSRDGVVVAFAAISCTIDHDSRRGTRGPTSSSLESRSLTFAGASAPRRPRRGRPAPSYVSALRLGNPNDCNQLLTVMFSVVNSPVKMSTPMVISTAPPTPMTRG